MTTKRAKRVARKVHSRGLALCFIASVVFLVILALVTWAFGQDHPFPFKTLEDITTGTPAWVSAGLPDVRYCPGVNSLISKYQFQSDAGSIWVVYTDGKLFSAAYFPPGISQPPASVVEGHIVEGKQVVVQTNVPYDSEKHRPCNPWFQKTTLLEG